MPDRNGALSPEMALDRYLDSVLAGLVTAPDDHLDPDLAATIQRVHELDNAPQPHPSFASTLWEDLISTQTLSPALPAQPGALLHTRPIPALSRWIAASVPRPLSRVAAAILLVVLLVGTVFVALYPAQQNRSVLPLFAPLATPNEEPVIRTDSPVLDLTLTDIPPLEAEGGMAVTSYPPGGSSQERAATSTEVLYIASGPMTVSVLEAPQPVRVVPPRVANNNEPEQDLSVGQELVLATGTTLVAPPETIIELVNEGSHPTAMLDLLWVTASRSTESGGAVWASATGGRRQDLTPPVSLVVYRVTLEAGGAFPAPESDEIVQSAASLDPNRKMDLRYESDGTVLNGGEEPVEVYILNVSDASAIPESTPSVTTSFEVVQLQFLWGSAGGPAPEDLPEGVDPDPMVNPYGVGIDPQGNVWVSDGAHGRFQIFAPDGTFLETWGDSGTAEGQFNFRATHGNPSYHYGDVAFDAAGNIYVADTGNFRVQKFASDRSFLLAWGGEGREDGQMLAPGGIAIGADGTVYVSDEGRSDVQMFDSEGRFLGIIGEAGTNEGQFSMPAGVTVGPDGDVWVADFGNHRIQRFSSEGDFLGDWGSFGSDDGQLHNPNDMAIDELGRVYVADLNNYRLQVFAPDGRYLTEIGGMGDEPGQFFTPNAVAVDATGVAYVSDNYRVQAFRLVTATTLATPQP